MFAAMGPVDKVKKKPQKIVSTHWWAENLIIVRMWKDKIHIKKGEKKGGIRQTHTN